jgi:hypothetical protein
MTEFGVPQEMAPDFEMSRAAWIAARLSLA